MNDELLTTTEVAEMLKVDERTVWVYRNLKDNPLPFVKLGGGAVRFRREAVEAWIRKQENVSKSSEGKPLESN